MAICDQEPHLPTERPKLLVIADKGYVSHELDHYLLKTVRQLIESVNDTAPPDNPPPGR